MSAAAQARKRERDRAYYAAHRDWFRAYHADPARRARHNARRRTGRPVGRPPGWYPSRVAGATPQLEVEELTAQALALVGIDVTPDPGFDAGWRDVVQEAVLALLEGRDPRTAIAAMRAQLRHAMHLIRDPRRLERIPA